MRAFLAAAAVVLALLPDVAVTQTPTRRSETYRSASVDSEGNLIIVKADGRSVVVRKQGEQTSFSNVVISPSKTAVGAQAMFANCCTSYDIPLAVVVYAQGKVHRFTGRGLPIFEWGFANHGTRVAFGQQPVHFACSVHYELRNIDSEQLLDSADLPQPCGQDPEPKAVPIPDWVRDIRRQK